jgi:hypothetical protein
VGDLKNIQKAYHRSLVVSNFNGYPFTEKRLPWLLNKTFLPPLYGISDFRVKNLDEKLLKVLMDAIDIIQRVLELGCEPAIRVKKTFRMKIRHPVKKLSMEKLEKGVVDIGTG